MNRVYRLEKCFNVNFLILTTVLWICKRMYKFLGNNILKYLEVKRRHICCLFSNCLEKKYVQIQIE